MSRLRVECLEALKQHGCLNSMEVCRVVNGFEPDDFRDCYPRGDFEFKTRPERCEFEARGCKYWSLKVYSALRTLENRRWIFSEKCRARDGGNNPSFKHTDIFRFWFLTRESFEERILSQTLIPHMEGREL